MRLVPRVHKSSVSEGRELVLTASPAAAGRATPQDAPVLELWSDEELAWIEVAPDLEDELAVLVSRLSGTGTMILCWRSPRGQRFPFSTRKYLAERRRALVAALRDE